LFIVCVLGRNRRYAWWKMAVQKSMNWELTAPMENGRNKATHVAKLL